MTWALCLQCGETKFGAICPCPACGTASTGNMGLDILFSDHHMSLETLEAFGKVVRSIRDACDDDQLRFAAFMHYVSTHHSELLAVNLPPEGVEECDAVLARADPPPVTIDASDRGRAMQKMAEEAGYEVGEET